MLNVINCHCLTGSVTDDSLIEYDNCEHFRLSLYLSYVLIVFSVMNIPNLWTRSCFFLCYRNCWLCCQLELEHLVWFAYT